jgi:hypothetical protein
MIHYKETPYGFEWGALKVNRLFSDATQKWVTLGIDMPKDQKIQVYVTEHGEVRIFDQQGEWTPPVKETGNQYKN